MDFYITYSEKMYFGKDEMSKLSFNGGFKEFVLSVGATIAKERGLDSSDVTVNKISWERTEAMKDNIPNCFKVEYDCVRHYDTNKIEKAFYNFLKSNGGSYDYIRFDCSAKPRIDIEITLPKSRKAIYYAPGGPERFREAIKSTVPYLDYVLVHCDVKFA